MTNANPALAARIVRTLREAGHPAYLAGGCVRDLLLDRAPDDYDVATAAAPEEILRLYPDADRIGAHFGVVLVRSGEGSVEVATFRTDHAYRDGRHPEGVTFETDPRQDALRRDFTINAMMMEPASGAILDFAGGRADLAAKLVRTVGDPFARFAEDHLRMLRAVRFAARLGFEIESETMTAMRALAPRIAAISAERVRGELERILTEGGAARGFELLREAGLLKEVLPEASDLGPLSAPGAPALTLAWAALLYRLPPGGAAAALERLRCSHDEIDQVQALLSNRPRFAGVRNMRTSELKRFLRMDRFDEHLELHRVTGGAAADREFVQAKLAEWPPEVLRPPRLATGDDLIAAGLTPGPEFGRLLDEIETEQLEGRLATREQALARIGGVH